jgi:hypothetical protein
MVLMIVNGKSTHPRSKYVRLTAKRKEALAELGLWARFKSWVGRLWRRIRRMFSRGQPV